MGWAAHLRTAARAFASDEIWRCSGQRESTLTPVAGVAMHVTPPLQWLRRARSAGPLHPAYRALSEGPVQRQQIYLTRVMEPVDPAETEVIAHACSASTLRLGPLLPSPRSATGTNRRSSQADALVALWTGSLPDRAPAYRTAARASGRPAHAAGVRRRGPADAGAARRSACAPALCVAMHGHRGRAFPYLLRIPFVGHPANSLQMKEQQRSFVPNCYRLRSFTPTFSLNSAGPIEWPVMPTAPGSLRSRCSCHLFRIIHQYRQ